MRRGPRSPASGAWATSATLWRRPARRPMASASWPPFPSKRAWPSSRANGRRRPPLPDVRRLTATRRGPLVAFAAAAAVGVACSWWAATGGPLLIAGWRLLLVLGAWAVAWLVAVFIAFRLPARLAVTLVVLAAVAMRLAALGGAPTTSDDLYRYAWDGRVQASGAAP